MAKFTTPPPPEKGKIQTFKLKPSYQSGRSMLEILAVIGLIALLSLAGIYGLRYAIAYYKADDLLDKGNLFAIMCSQQIQKNKTTDCRESLDMLQIHGATATVGNGLFSLTVPQTQQLPCKILARQNWPILWGLKNGTLTKGTDIDSSGGNCTDDMDLTMIFTDDLMSAAQAAEKCADMSCTPPASCNKGFCICPGEKVYRNNQCQCEDPTMTGENCDIRRNCPEGQFSDYFGNCYDCSIKNLIGVNTNETSHAECLACGNRYVTAGNTCEIKCPDGQFNHEGTCISCDDPKPYYSSGTYAHKESCLACGNRWMNGGYCAKICDKNQFFDAYGACHECSEAKVISLFSNEAAAESCLQCPTRYVSGTNSKYCELCPTGQIQNPGGNGCVTP